MPDGRRQENSDRNVLGCTSGSEFSDNAVSGTFAESSLREYKNIDLGPGYNTSVSYVEIPNDPLFANEIHNLTRRRVLKELECHKYQALELPIVDGKFLSCAFSSRNLTFVPKFVMGLYDCTSLVVIGPDGKTFATHQTLNGLSPQDKAKLQDELGEILKSIIDSVQGQVEFVILGGNYFTRKYAVDFMNYINRFYQKLYDDGAISSEQLLYISEEIAFRIQLAQESSDIRMNYVAAIQFLRRMVRSVCKGSDPIVLGPNDMPKPVDALIVNNRGGVSIKLIKPKQRNPEMNFAYPASEVESRFQNNLFVY